MNNQKLTALLLITAGPFSLFAAPADDRRIEDAAKSTYNYRTVLEDNVKVKAKDGIVTLTGTVQDQGDKTLAADTVENLPGVTAVKNEIVVKPLHEEKSDSWIALKVRGRLLMKGNVSATATNVVVKDGVVTLTGSAENLAQKELTGVYAAEIDGVRSVRNDIVIEADADMADADAGKDRIDDASITSQVKYALLAHKSTSALKTKVATKDGTVVISGIAGSDAEKSLVTKLARDVRGVRSVTNDMTVAKS